MDRTVIKRLLVILILSSSIPIFLLGCGTATEGISTIPPVPSGNSITLAWRAPDRNSDGSSLTDLAGFRVYYGLRSGIYTNMIVVRGETSCSIGELPGEVTLHLVVTAFDNSGNESNFPEEVKTDLPALM